MSVLRSARWIAVAALVAVLAACADAPAASPSAEATPPPTPSPAAVPDWLAGIAPDELLGTPLAPMRLEPTGSLGEIYDAEVGRRMAEAFGIEPGELEVAGMGTIDEETLPGVAILAIRIPDGFRMAATGAYLYEIGSRPGTRLAMEMRERDRDRLELWVNDGWLLMSRDEALFVVAFDRGAWLGDDRFDLDALIVELEEAISPTAGPVLERETVGETPARAPDLEARLPPNARVQVSATFTEDGPGIESWAAMEEELRTDVTTVELVSAIVEADGVIVNAIRIDGIAGARLVALELGSRYASPSLMGGNPSMQAGEAADGRRFLIGEEWAFHASSDVAYSFVNGGCLFGCPVDVRPFVDAVARAVGSIPEDPDRLIGQG